MACAALSELRGQYMPADSEQRSRKCTKCGAEKPETSDYFYRRRTRKSGWGSHCKACVNAFNKAKYHFDVEATRARSRDRARLNRKEHAAQTAEWRRANPEKAKALAANFYATHGDYRRRYSRDYYRKRSSEPAFIVLKRLRYRLWEATSKRKRVGSTLDLLGCSIKELVAHLESKFLPGMSWENRGAWHIDHIKPCACFDLSDANQQRECFHYTNLQPLWASDNRAKGAKYREEEPCRHQA